MVASSAPSIRPALTAGMPTARLAHMASPASSVVSAIPTPAVEAAADATRVNAASAAST